MTSTIKVTSHNYPVQVETYDNGHLTGAELLRPEDGERTFYTTTTRELRIIDIDESVSETNPGRAPTLGEQRVRLAFNPSADDLVARLKRKSAELIDICEQLKVAGKDGRCCALAQTAYEEAAMWAVKAATS